MAAGAKNRAGDGGKRRTASRARTPDGLAAARARYALEAARADKLLGGGKTHLLSARLDAALVAAAKARTGIASDTRLVELALATLAVGDDFGEWLVTQGGRLKADFELDL